MSSILVFPDEKNTDWIAWKKITKKSGGIESSRFRCTSERFPKYNNTFPSLSISPLTVSIRPLHYKRNSLARPVNSNLLISLPPFSGSLKSRHTANIIPDCRIYNKETLYNSEILSRNKEFKTKFLLRESFLLGKNSSKQVSQRKIKRFLKKNNNFKPKLEGIIGIRLLNGLIIGDDEEFDVKGKKNTFHKLK